MSCAHLLRLSSTESTTQTIERVLTARPWNVVVWDDPVTPMTVVVVIFRKIFAFSLDTATRLMLQVHHEGRAVVWTGDRERAEGFCARLHAHGLLASIEQES